MSTGFAKVAPSGPTDYFALFDMPRRYGVDLEELERRYLARSKVVHPDRFVGRPAGERVAAMSQSMDLNKAYKVLRKPVSRAEHLLELRGLTIDHNEVLEPAFLMDVLEAREELAEAKVAGDASRLEQLRHDMESREAAALAAIEGGFSTAESAPADASNGAPGQALAEIKRQLILLRYIRRYLEAFADDE